MRTTSILSAATGVLTLASARIYGFSAPTTVARDSTIKLEIEAANYIQSIQDVAISFGISPASSAHPESLGTLLDSKFLGPDLSNTVGNITHYVHIPATQPKGKTVLTAAHFSLLGAVLTGDVEYFNVTVEVGDSTSAEYVSSS
jgi:hypothetical protein